MSTFHKDPQSIAAKETGPLPDGARTDRTRSDRNRRGLNTRSAAVVIAVTLQRLVEDGTRSWNSEEVLVLDALRRSTGALKEASDQELAAYLESLAPDQLRGVISNTKGIFHELLFERAENLDGDDVMARVFEKTNEPGADVEFIMDGEVVRAVQLKAVQSPAHVVEHLEKYPSIDVVATEEVASKIEGVDGSGFRNVDLEARVAGTFQAVPGDDLLREIADGVGTSALVAGAMTAGKALRQRRVSRVQLAQALGDLGIGGVTATALDVLLDTVA